MSFVNQMFYEEDLCTDHSYKGDFGQKEYWKLVGDQSMNGVSYDLIESIVCPCGDPFIDSECRVPVQTSISLKDTSDSVCGMYSDTPTSQIQICAIDAEELKKLCVDIIEEWKIALSGFLRASDVPCAYDADGEIHLHDPSRSTQMCSPVCRTMLMDLYKKSQEHDRAEELLGVLEGLDSYTLGEKSTRRVLIVRE